MTQFNVPDLLVQVAFGSDPLVAPSVSGTLTGAANSVFSTPDAARLDITGDIEIVARVKPTALSTGAAQAIVAKAFIFSVSYWLNFSPSTNTVSLQTTPDGSSGVSAESDAVFTDNQWVWVRARLDVDDGAGNRVYTFHVADGDLLVEPTGSQWVSAGSTTVSGTTSIYVSTLDLLIGQTPLSTNMLAGSVSHVFIRDGIGGTLVSSFVADDAKTSSVSSWRSANVPAEVWTKGSAASLTVTPTWTDITSYVRSVNGVSTSRGKQTEIETYGAGRMSLTLDNRDRRFTPNNSSSPYSPNVQPRKLIRVSGVWDDTRFTIFQGFVEGWPRSFPAQGHDSVVEVTAYDALALLSEVTLEDAAFTQAVASGAKLIYRTLSNGALTNEGSEGATSATLLSKRRGTSATTTAATVGPSQALSFDGNTYYSTPAPIYASLFNPIATYMAWITTTSVGPASGLLELMNGALAENRIGVNSSGQVQVELDVGVWTSRATVNDGEPHHVAVRVDVAANAEVSIFIDGRDETVTVTPPVVVLGATRWFDTIGANPALPVGVASARWVGTISDVMFFPSVVTAADIRALYNLGRGQLSESTAARVERIADVAGVPTGLVAVSGNCAGEVLDIDLFGQSVLSQLQLVADSEQGRLFVSRDGRVTQQGRSHWRSGRGLVSQITFSDQPGAGEYDYRDLGFDYSDREVRNVVTVSGSANLSATVTDSASVSAFGQQSGSVSTLLATADQVTQLATGLLALRKAPVERADALLVKPARNTAMWPTVLGLDLGDRFTVKVNPAGSGGSTTYPMAVERVDWSIRPDNWDVSIQGSPIPDVPVGVFDQATFDDGFVFGY